MKQFLTYIMIALLASFCSKVEVPTPPEPEHKEDPAPDPQPEQQDAPVLQLIGADKPLVLGPDYDNDEVSIRFTIENADKDIRCNIYSPAGLYAYVTFTNSEHTEGSVSCRSTTGDIKDLSEVTMTVTNKCGSDSKTFSVERFKLAIDIDDEEFSVDNENRIIRYSNFKPGNVVMKISSNKDIRGLDLSADEDWLHAYAVDSTMCVDWNEQTAGRSTTLKVSEVKQGFLEASYCTIAEYTLQQAGGDGVSIYEYERNALIAIYKSMGGENWDKEAANGEKVVYWCTDQPVSKWLGVELAQDGSGHVEVVDISHFGHMGTIPEEVGDLVYCKHFEFATSEGYINPDIYQQMLGVKPRLGILGGLPKSLKRLRRVQYFDIDHNTSMDPIELNTCVLRDLVRYNKELSLLSLNTCNFTGCCPEWLADINGHYWLHTYVETPGVFMANNRLVGKVPEKVKNHPSWTAIVAGVPQPGGGYGYSTRGVLNMIQQEGYGLWE